MYYLKDFNLLNESTKNKIIMGIFIRMFCKHKWKTHTKKVYEWTQKVEGTWDRAEKISETS